MRLLNTSTLKLEEFIGNKIPRYAILSHRWEEEEFTYKDSLSQGIASILAGYAKIEGCCRQAAQDGHNYVWVDSCCIDKSSSAELSEAINSMFKWYQRSEVCYAYLSDVPNADDNHHRPDSPFRRSKWFTRGWTLQELLAPKRLVFFDKDWKRLPWMIPPRQVGVPALRLDSLIEEITGIKDLKNYESCSVAQKMSWASRRVTTREEDIAYCLLGLFGVNMPPLYGEGEKAFLRLQLEILRMSDDESIFAWTNEKSCDGGLLAPSPVAFRESGNVERGKWDSPSYTMTNKGLYISFRLIKHWNNQTSLATEDALLAPLNCNQSNKLGQLAVLLKKVNKDQYVRTLSNKLLTMQQLPQVYEKTPRHALYVRQYDAPLVENAPYVFYIPILPLIKAGYRISTKYLSHPYRSKWDADSTGQYILTLTAQEICGALMFKDEHRDVFVLVIDVQLNFPSADVVPVKDGRSLGQYWDGSKETPRRDEVAKRTLPFGPLVSVSLAERGIFSKHQYTVTISVEALLQRWVNSS